MIERERLHLRVSLQESVNGAPQITDPFSVNDPDLENAFLAASFQVVGNQIFDLLGTESMQVKHAIDRKLDGLVH